MRVFKHAGGKAIGVWSGHKIFTSVFTSAIAFLLTSLFRGWHGWAEVLPALYLLGLSFLVFLALLGLGFLGFLWWAPADLDRTASERIRLFENRENEKLDTKPYGDLVQRKIINNLDSCTLDGLRVIEYINGSGLVLEGELVEKFGAEALEDAKRSMLLRAQTTHVRSGANEPIETNLYSFRDEYEAELKGILLRRQQV